MDPIGMESKSFFSSFLADLEVVSGGKVLFDP